MLFWIISNFVAFLDGKFGGPARREPLAGGGVTIPQSQSNDRHSEIPWVQGVLDPAG